MTGYKPRAVVKPRATYQSRLGATAAIRDRLTELDGAITKARANQTWHARRANPAQNWRDKSTAEKIAGFFASDRDGGQGASREQGLDLKDADRYGAQAEALSQERDRLRDKLNEIDVQDYQTQRRAQSTPEFDPGPDRCEPVQARFVTEPIQRPGYTVAPRDTLWDIAHRQLGDATRWREIYDLNRHVIGENPNLIHPNQVFDLPELNPVSAPPLFTDPLRKR